jgi:hypothetical protein
MNRISLGGRKAVGPFAAFVFGLVGLACRSDGVPTSTSGSTTSASAQPEQPRDQVSDRDGLHELEAALPATAGWMPRTSTRRTVTPDWLGIVQASYEDSEKAYLKLTLIDKRSAFVMDAAGDLTGPDLGKSGDVGFTESRPKCGHRVLWRGNPSGDDAGGVVKVFVDDRFVVEARGNRLTLETIGTSAHKVADRLDALAAARPSDTL